MTCSHRDRTLHTLVVRVIVTNGVPCRMVRVQCDRCHAFISLGHSDDAPVQHEIRAAEIAVGLQEGGIVMSALETAGFNGESLRTRAGALVLIDSASTRAGHLARCIIEHEDAS